MFRGSVLAAFACIITIASVPFASSQQKAAEDEITVRLREIGDLSIVDDTQKLVADARGLLKEISPDSGETRNRSKDLSKLRPFRARIGKRGPELRATLESFRQYKTALRATLQQPALVLASDIDGDIAKAKNKIDDAQNYIESKKEALVSEKDEREKQNIQTNIRLAEADIKRTQAEIDRFETRKRDNAETAKSAQLEKDKVARTIAKIDELLNEGQVAARNLDDVSTAIDDTASALLQTEVLNLSYTDKSTIVFGVLVGAVIVGFFGIAIFSPNVRDAIFTGDSGIQFVTLFSLVIAIILFGVLKILEGKELAALLGGLSGYILGRGSHMAGGRNGGGQGGAGQGAGAGGG
jgi:hypothetical protein